MTEHIRIGDVPECHLPIREPATRDYPCLTLRNGEIGLQVETDAAQFVIPVCDVWGSESWMGAQTAFRFDTDESVLPLESVHPRTLSGS